MVDPTKVYDVVCTGKGWFQVKVIEWDDVFVKVEIVDPKRSLIQLDKGAKPKLVRQRLHFIPPIPELLTHP